MSKVIPKNVLEDIRSANDIVEVVGAYLQLKRGGAAHKALCPFHKEKTPSFNVNPRRQIYHCFGCGAGGDVFKFVMEYESVDFSTAARMLAERAGIRLEWADTDESGGPAKDSLLKIHEEVAQVFHRALLETPGAERARQYLKERELDENTVKNFLIGYAPDSRDALLRWRREKKYSIDLFVAAGLIMKSEQGDVYDRFRNRLMFPIRDELGRVIGFSGRILEKSDKLAKYVNSPETAIFKKGRVLYALDKAKRNILDAKTAILCEGQIDVIRCHRAGIQTAVAAQGTALTDDHARLLKRYADSVIIALDADKAGQDASLRSAEALLGAGLSASIAALPKGDDPDSLIRKKGGQAFLDIVKNAKSVIEFQIDVLGSRENVMTQDGLLRVTQAVLETMAKVPTETQRHILFHQAWRRLGMKEEALRDTYNQFLKKRQKPNAQHSTTPPTPVQHPTEEVALAELLSSHGSVAELVRHHLPLDLLTDPTCRKIIEHLLGRLDGEVENLSGKLAGEDAECRRLAAQIQMSPPKISGKESTPESAAKDMILVIWKKTFERRRTELRRRLESVTGVEKERLDIQGKQLTLDIKTIQQGWEKALPILEL
jgi:DNA primase